MKFMGTGKIRGIASFMIILVRAVIRQIKIAALLKVHFPLPIFISQTRVMVTPGLTSSSQGNTTPRSASLIKQAGGEGNLLTLERERES